MKPIRLIALLLALLMTFSVIAVADEAVDEVAEDDPLLATVNFNREIYKSEVDTYVDEINSYYSQYGMNPADESIAAAVRQMAMETCLQTIFYDQKAIELGFDPLSPEDALALMERIDATYEDLIKQVYTYFGMEPAADATAEDKASAREDAISMLDSMGYTYDYIGLNERRNFLYGKVNDYLTGSLTVSEEDLLNTFNSHVEADRQQYENDPSTYEIYTSYYGEKPYFVPEGFRGITHILLSVDEDLLKTYQDLQSRFEEQAEPEEDTGSTEGTETEQPEVTEEPEEPVTVEQVEQARLAVIASVQDTIDEIYAKLDAGTPWLDLVDEYSTDPGMKQESNRTNGYSVFADSLMYDSAFVQASFSVDEIGDVSQPYVGMYGIYIVHYTRDVPSGPIELTEEIRATLEEELLSEARNTLMNNALETWILNTIIEYTEEGEAYKPAISVEPDDTEAVISDEGAAIEEIGE